MAVTAAEIIEIMIEVGIEKDIIDQLKPDVPYLNRALIRSICPCWRLRPRRSSASICRR